MSYAIDRTPSILDDERNAQLCDFDRQILAVRTIARRELRQTEQGPLVGDFIQREDGTLTRIAHCWGHGVQPARVRNGKDGSHVGSIHLCKSGRGNYSGALASLIPTGQIEKTDEQRVSCFWIFHRGVWRAHADRHVSVLCPVWRERAA